MNLPSNLRFAITVLCLHPLVFISTARGQKMPDLPINCEAVEKALATENLRAIAAGTEDADLLLGLTYLAQAGDPVRQEISQRLVKIKPEHESIVAVLAVQMEGPDEESVAAILKRDPENALGHYLQANLLRRADRDDEALEAFRKAAKCRELRLYEPVTSEALFKALDALNLKDRERLCALSWIAAKSSNFYIGAIQPLDDGLEEIADLSANDKREEISDLLLILAGHLYSTNFHNRWYAQRALQSAFRLKAEVAASENSPKMNGYAAVTQALVSTMIRWPELEDETNARDIARFMPSRVYGAFNLTDPAHEKSAHWAKGIPEEHKAEFEQAKQAWIKAAEALIDVASKDPDGIVGPYLKGMPAPPADQQYPWVSQYTYVERAMKTYPETFKAAAAYEKEMRAVWAARQRLDPKERNIWNMMQVGYGITAYAFRHENKFPPGIDVVFQKGFLKPPLEAKSVLSGRAYVYVAAGDRWPEKSHEAANFIILYDDHELDGHYECIMADGHGEHVPVEKVKEQLRARGK